ncbi:MAG: NlpC/P60 family protein [Desulfosporosinus sp.]|nr:NlpC/P60 family protein [Desulfosporosinus sp.]
MTKKLTILIMLAFFLVLGNTQTAQASSSCDTLLKTGSTGANVVQLQTELNYLGYDVGATDGIFGTKTQSEVVAFQTRKSLSVDGIVGSITADSLNKVYTEKTPIVNANVIIATAEKYIGVPYRWGGESPTRGFDCSGFVQYVFAKNGITLPRVSYDQATVGTPINFCELQPGDLIFLSTETKGIVSHVGIYIGNDQFINASCSKGVTIYPIGPYWKSIYFGARRVL